MLIWWTRARPPPAGAMDERSIPQRSTDEILPGFALADICAAPGCQVVV